MRSIQLKRERSDYEAWAAPEEEARRVIELADQFLAAVQGAIGDGGGAISRGEPGA